MLTYLRALISRDERGASAVEYGLLCAGVVAVCIVAWGALTDTVQGEFSRVNTSEFSSSTP